MPKKRKKKKICAVYGEGAVIDQMCQKWFVKFSDGDLSPQSGWPVKVDNDQTEILTENNQNDTTWEIVDIFKISKSNAEKSFPPAWLC